MATHSSSLAWKIPWMEEPGRLHSPWGCKWLDTTERPCFSLVVQWLEFSSVTAKDLGSVPGQGTEILQAT